MYYKKLKNAALYEYLSALLQIIGGIDSDLIRKNPVVLALMRHFAVYEDGFKKVVKSRVSPRLEMSDASCANSFRELKFGVYSKSYSSIEAERTAANRINTIIDSFGRDLDRLPYSEQLGTSKKLIIELRKPENTTDLTTLAMQGVVERYHQAVVDMGEVYMDKITEEEMRNTVEAASKTRPEIEALLRQLRTVTESMVASNVDNVWLTLQSKLNALDAQYDHLTQGRHDSISDSPSSDGKE